MTRDPNGDRGDRRELATWTGAYSLDALSSEEKAEFEAFLLDNDEARSEVTELGDTAVLLGLATPPEQPPAELKGRLMDMIAQTPQLSAAPVVDSSAELSRIGRHALESDAAAGDATPADPGAPSVATPSRPQTAGERTARARWFTRPVAGLTAAAAAIALIVGVSVVGSGVIRDSDQANQINQIVAAADYQRDSAEISTGGTATVMWSETLGKAAVMFDGLGAPPSGHVYELWYIDTKGTATPAGVFTPKGQTHNAVLEGDMSQGDTIGVTVEPDGGSAKPTSAPIVAIGTSA